MSSAYYLLNDELRFYFDDNPRTLHYGDESVKLTPKEAQTLQFAAINAEKIIRADEIAVYLWGEEAVNNDYQNKKSQAITHVSKIRKRLEQLKYPHLCLQTEENQGYRLICPVELVTEQVEQAIALDATVEQRKQHLNVFKYSGISAAMTIFLLALVYWLGSESTAKVVNVKPLPHRFDVSTEPRYSPDGKAIVFSRESGEKVAQINLKVEADINYRQLTDGFFDQAPIFSPDGERLAFHRTDNGQCSIMLMHLNGEYEKTANETKIADCSTHTAYSSIAWLSNDMLLFTDRKEELKPLEVYKLDLTTSQVTAFLTQNDISYYGAGFYYVLHDIESKETLVLDGENWVTTNIYRVIEGGQKQLIKTVQDSLRSIAFYQDSIVYKDLDNKLKMFILQRPIKSQVIYDNPLSPIDYPAVNSRHGKLAFVSGEYYKSTIFRYDLPSGDSFEVLPSEYNIQLPLAKNEEILLVSRESGVNQVYGYQPGDLRGQYQISDFEINRKIVGIAASDNQKWLAITFPSGTTLYRRSEKGLSKVEHFPFMLFPDFAKTNQRMLLADHSRSGSQLRRLVEFDLSKYDTTAKVEPSGIVVNDANFGIYRDKEIVYTPDDTHGVYLFSVGSTTLINGDVYPISASAFALDNGHLYLAIRGRKIVKMAMDSGQTNPLPNALFTSFSVNGESLYYTSQTRGVMNILAGEIKQQ